MKQLFFRLYLLLILTFVGLGWSIDKLYSSVTAERQLTSDVALHQGTFFLLEAELKRHPADERLQHLTAVSTSFGYPIQVVSLTQLKQLSQSSNVELSPEQIKYLTVGGIVAFFDDLAGESWFLKKLTDTETIIVLGPILTEPIVQSDVIYTVIFFIGLAFIVFIWVWPISNGLVALTKATTAFGKGDFSVRATQKVPTPLIVLAERFNAMAGRIQRLIKSHKELSHAVSHELRTPIARIRFAMEILREEEDKALVNQYLNTMDENIEELDALVDELLVYARFDREEPVLQLTNVDLVILLKELIKRFSLTEPTLTFTLEAENGNAPVMCLLDKEGITRVVDNLVRNAVRYAKAHIKIVLHATQDDVTIEVLDDGIGIPESEWQHLFEPFVRLDQSRDRKSGGIGLGLAIVKRFIELHRGTVRISHASLGGASFVLNWPRRL